MNLFTIQIHRHKNKFMVTKGERLGEGINWEFRINIYTLLYIKKKNDNKDLLYSTGNYTQYFVVTNKGKESEKEYIHICITDHFTVHLK